MYINYFTFWGRIFVTAKNFRPLSFRVAPNESSWLIPGTYIEEDQEDLIYGLLKR